MCDSRKKNQPLQVLVIGTTHITETIHVWNTWRNGILDAITIIDPDFTILNRAHAASRFERQQIRFFQAEQANLPVISGSFDVVVSHGLLDRVNNAEAMSILQESLRVMHPYGIQLHTTVCQITPLGRLFKDTILGGRATQTAGTNLYYRTQETTTTVFRDAGMRILSTFQEQLQQAATYVLAVR